MCTGYFVIEGKQSKGAEDDFVDPESIGGSNAKKRHDSLYIHR